MKPVLACALFLLMAACGGDKAVPVATEDPRLDYLCPPIMLRLDNMDAEIQELSAGAQVEDPRKHVYKRSTTAEQVDRINKARHDFLRVRRKAAALGCIIDTG